MRSPARPPSRSGGSDAEGIGARIGVMIVGTGAMIGGTAARSFGGPSGHRGNGGGADRDAVA
jgi:hypothetical protein